MNSNTPALIKKVIINSNVATTETSTLQSQTFTIDTNNTTYLNNSSISITNIEVSYSQLGLLEPPQIISNKIKTLNNSINSGVQNTLSILDTNSDIKNLYDYILSLISKSENAANNISKETYLLLALDDLINLTDNISTLLLSSDFLINNQKSFETEQILSYICDALIHVTKTIKLLNALIGISSLTSNYVINMCDELTTSLNSIYSINNILQDSKNLDDEISTILTSLKEYINMYKSSIPSFSDINNLISQLIKCFEIIINHLLETDTSMNSITTNNFLISLQNVLSLISNINLIVNLACSDLSNNLSIIITNINLALSYPNSIKLIENDLNLTTTSKINLYQKKSFSKTFKDNDISNSEFSNINNNTTPTEESFNLVLSFSISNLSVCVNGTIGSANFTGHVYYPDLYNLIFFGFNDIIFPINITIEQNTRNFSLTNDIDAKLTVTSIVPNTSYNINYPSSFTADINFLLSLNNNILVTSTIPIVFLN